MSAEIVVTNDPAELARKAALRVAAVLSQAIRERDWGFVALPGGPLVRAVYDELVLLQLPWDKVEFYFTDERCVPPRHPASNYGEAQDILLKNQRIGLHQIHRIEAESADRELAAARYAEEIPEVFDVMLFELGQDGHIGSLFAGSPALDETERRAVHVVSPLKPKDRITLTPPVIAAALATIVIASGREKAQAVARAVEGAYDPRALPAQLVRDGLWVLDRGAAMGLTIARPAG